MRASEDPGHERAEIGFPEIVRSKFAFVERLGFKVVDASATLVCYQCGRVGLEVYHGRRSYEIHLDVSRDGGRYPLSAVIGVSDPEGAEKCWIPAARDRASLEAGVQRIAELLANHGQAALEGDPHFFTSLEDLVKARGG